MSSVVDITQAVKSAPNSKEGLDIQGVEEENRLNSSDATDKIIAASLSQPPADKDTSLGNTTLSHPLTKTPALATPTLSHPLTKTPALATPTLSHPLTKTPALATPTLSHPLTKTPSLATPTLSHPLTKTPSLATPTLSHPLTKTPSLATPTLSHSSVKRTLSLVHRGQTHLVSSISYLKVRHSCQWQALRREIPWN
jgi:hypothetical protein